MNEFFHFSYYYRIFAISYKDKSILWKSIHTMFFISCKSEDYKFAEEIYEYLKNNDIHTFLASRELRNFGDSEYRKAISKAMKSTYHLIVFASKLNHKNQSGLNTNGGPKNCRVSHRYASDHSKKTSGLGLRK